MSLYVITGANGFIGRHLLKDFMASGHAVRALTRNASKSRVAAENVEWVVGDISDKATWERLLEPGCTVINLAYSHASVESAALEATKRMVEACANAGIARLIHCSTVSVYGRAHETLLTEASACNPLDEYGRIKLAVEQQLLGTVGGRFEVAILRPSAVFGVGGEALITLVNHLTKGNRMINYCRSSLFGRRKTHLVPVETVVAALGFLCQTKQPIDTETFIVSDDDDPFNNFRDIERVLMEELDVPPYHVAPGPLPRLFLETLMRVKGRANINTRTEYRSDKLLNRGFKKPVTLEDALRRFAARQKKTSAGGGRV
jgi:nucleoside-diphosphate-sugar epimerase